jgi:hypothetical protein
VTTITATTPTQALGEVVNLIETAQRTMASLEAAVETTITEGGPSPVIRELVDLQSYLTGESGTCLEWPGATDRLSDALKVVEAFAA